MDAEKALAMVGFSGSGEDEQGNNESEDKKNAGVITNTFLE